MQKKSIPRHVGIVLDGNRRWAKEQGLSPQDGHKKGFATFKTIADASLERGIAYLSVFAFSTENWNRAKEEVAFLLSYVQIVLKKYTSELHKKNVRFLWLGSTQGLSDNLVRQLRAAEVKTQNNSAATLCMCFNYGGQQEIVDAANAVISSKQPLTSEILAQSLYGGEAVPPIDLLIRTSGEQRISNFMLWRAAYSELYFTPTLWPDFSVQDLDAALAEYATRRRRFGA